MCCYLYIPLEYSVGTRKNEKKLTMMKLLEDRKYMWVDSTRETSALSEIILVCLGI